MEKFHEHEYSSNMHELATEKLAAKVKRVVIDAQLDAQLRNEQEQLQQLNIFMYEVA